MRTRPDKIRIFHIARASLEKARYYLILANDLRRRAEITYPIGLFGRME